MANAEGLIKQHIELYIMKQHERWNYKTIIIFMS
jgi:hypothetical protein